MKGGKAKRKPQNFNCYGGRQLQEGSYSQTPMFFQNFRLAHVPVPIPAGPVPLIVNLYLELRAGANHEWGVCRMYPRAAQDTAKASAAGRVQTQQQGRSNCWLDALHVGA